MALRRNVSIPGLRWIAALGRRHAMVAVGIVIMRRHGA